jgi:UDP-N-acetylglucosamine/UDP-N-acetylgalactosamine diphosphorylase
VVSTLREEEFAPLKNDSGPDSPETVRQAISGQAGDWLRRAGAVVPADNASNLEISPLFALDVEELRSKITPGFRAVAGTYLQ